MTIYSKFKTALLACVLSTGIAMASNTAVAQNGASPVDVLPAKSLNNDTNVYDEGNDTHPPLKISPDKSELIRLERPAGSVIIGSPTHLSILADSATTLVLVPQLPGATYVTILDKKGDILMQRHVIVASPKKKYVRIRKTCTADDDACQPTEVYYCPDTCHNVGVAQAQSSGDSQKKTSVTAEKLTYSKEGPAPVEDNVKDSDGN